MDFNGFLNIFQTFQKTILEFVDDDSQHNNDPNFLDDLKNQISYPYELKIILYMLLNISNYHHRSKNFYQKIEQILKYFKDYIIQNFTSSEIATIFQDSRIIILFLYNEGMIKIEDFVEKCVLDNSEFLALHEIEQNLDLFYQKESIFIEIIYKFKYLFKKKMANLINDYKILYSFTKKFTNSKYPIQKYYGYRNDINDICNSEIDFCDIYIQFKTFVEKEIDNKKDILKKYLFFIALPELKFKDERNNDLYFDNIIYKFMFLQLKPYQDSKVCIPNHYNKICSIKKIDREEDNDKHLSFYTIFSVKLLEFIFCNQKYTELENYIFSIIETIHNVKNKNEKIILMSKISSFTEKLDRSNPIRSFSFSKFCSLTALFVDDIIEKILEFEFSDFLQDTIALLNDEYQKCLEYSKTHKENILIGENDSYIFKLIRDDSIVEFIVFVNQKNIILSSQIEFSIFETNIFLLKNQPTLIEYAAFFGSIQIFQYLMLNGVELTPSLWLFAIHGRNADIIHILEENEVKPPRNTYQECIKESIQCYHNEITDYLMNNFNCLKKEKENNKLDEIQEISIKSYNFEYFPSINAFNSCHYCELLYEVFNKEREFSHMTERKKYIMHLINECNFISHEEDPFLKLLDE